jgi:hypothetical protein
LILSEVLGADVVMVDCKQKLAKMLASAKGGEGSRLPSIIMEGIEQEYIKDIESKLTAHLLMYGIDSPKRVEPDSLTATIHPPVAPKVIPSQPHKPQPIFKQPQPAPHSDTSVTTNNSNNSYESTEASAFFSDDEDGNRTSGRQSTFTPRHHHQRSSQSQQHFQSPSGITDSEQSFHDDDLHRHRHNREEVRKAPMETAQQHVQFAQIRRNHPVSQQYQPAPFDYDDNASDISSIHSVNSWSVGADESHFLKSSSVRNAGHMSRSQFSPPSSAHHISTDQPMRMSDISNHNQHHVRLPAGRNPPYQPAKPQQSVEGYSKTVWQAPQQASSFPQPNRSRSPNVREAASRVKSPHDSVPSRSTSPRWNISQRPVSRSTSPVALSTSQSKQLSGEDLKLR